MQNFKKFKHFNDKLFMLNSLLKNRVAAQVYFISASSLRIVAATNQGYCVIPVSAFNKEHDFVLNLVENYLQ